MRAEKVAVLVALGIAVGLTGCYESDALMLFPEDSGHGVDLTTHDAGIDFGPLPTDMFVPDVPCIPVPAPRPLDVLFAVDNSPSMVEEQATLAAEIPDFIRALTNGDIDGDGFQDPGVQKIDDIHAGVITTSMGVAGIPNVPTCMMNPDFGDDAILLTQPRVGGTGCLADYPSFLEYVGGMTSGPEFSTSVTCLARTGTAGCGFEQQLDAVIKAVVPSWTPFTFAEGTHGHGDDANAGFLRPGSVLAIVLVTDEDDCSTAVSDIWNPLSADHTGDLNLRCVNYFSDLHPVLRYSNALETLSSDVVFLAITGVPEDLVSTTPINYMVLLADARMQNHITVMGGTSSLDPACSVSGRGAAAPAIRIAELASQLGPEDGLVQSICSDDYRPALTAFMHMIAPKVGTANTCMSP